MSDLGRMLLAMGVLLVGGGLLLMVGGFAGRGAWIRRLPGDILGEPRVARVRSHPRSGCGRTRAARAAASKRRLDPEMGADVAPVLRGHRLAILVPWKAIMRKAALVIATLGALTLTASPAAAWHRWHGGVFIDIGPWWIPPPRYYVAPPPTVVIESPPVYVEQAPASPPTPARPAQESYWYYCPSKQGYYPYVPSCPEPWVPVPARPPQ